MHPFLAWMAAPCALYPQLPNWLAILVAILVVEAYLGESKKIPPNSILALMFVGARWIVVRNPVAAALLARVGASGSARAPGADSSSTRAAEPDPSPLASGAPSSATFPAAGVPGRVVADVTPTGPAPKLAVLPRDGQRGGASVGVLLVLALLAALLLAGCTAESVAPAIKVGAFAACVIAVVLYLRALRPSVLVLVAACAVGASACAHGTDAGYHAVGLLAVVESAGATAAMPIEHEREMAIDARVKAAPTQAVLDAALADATTFQQQRAKVHAGLADARNLLVTATEALGLVDDGSRPSTSVPKVIGDAMSTAAALARTLRDFGVPLPASVTTLIGGK